MNLIWSGFFLTVFLFNFLFGTQIFRYSDITSFVYYFIFAKLEKNRSIFIKKFLTVIFSHYDIFFVSIKAKLIFRGSFELENEMYSSEKKFQKNLWFFRTHIEMTSKEHTELFKRLQNPDFSRFQRRKRVFWVLVSVNFKNIKILKKKIF